MENCLPKPKLPQKIPLASAHPYKKVVFIYEPTIVDLNMMTADVK